MDGLNIGKLPTLETLIHVLRLKCFIPGGELLTEQEIKHDPPRRSAGFTAQEPFLARSWSRMITCRWHFFAKVVWLVSHICHDSLFGYTTQYLIYEQSWSCMIMYRWHFFATVVSNICNYSLFCYTKQYLIYAQSFQWIPIWQGLDGFQKLLCSCALDESSLSIGKVNVVLPGIGNSVQNGLSW